MASRRLGVLIVGVNFAPESSGIAPYTSRLAQGLLRRGHNVRVFTSFPHYPEWRQTANRCEWSREEQWHGVRITRLRHYIPSVPTAIRRALFEVSFGARVVAARWGDPDVIIVVSPALISSATAAARALVGPRRPALGLVVQDLYSRGVQETGAAGRHLGGIMAFLEARVARSADGVTVIHDRFRVHLTKELGVSESRVRAIRNWRHIESVPDFDTGRFRSACDWPEGHVIVLHSGAMGVKQGLETVVEAARLAEARREPVRFVLLGNGSQRASLEQLAEGVRCIDFLDSLSDEDFVRALRSADVLLVSHRPGVKEMAVPSKLTSYFSSGRPVLAAADADSTTAEELRLSGGGVRVNPGEPLALLNAALELGRNATRSRRLGDNGRRYCAEILSEETAIQQYDEWVRDLAARGRRQGRGRCRKSVH